MRIAIPRRINEESESQISPHWNPLRFHQRRKCARDIEMKSSRASAGGRAGTGEICSLAELNIRHDLPAPQ
ncbi:MAG: hypothetical protein WBD65_15975, partial [Methylocella sp.]